MIKELNNTCDKAEFKLYSVDEEKCELFLVDKEDNEKKKFLVSGMTNTYYYLKGMSDFEIIVKNAQRFIQHF